MKTGHRRRIKDIFYYLNPKNVSAAISIYGYTYSVGNTILLFGAVIVIVSGLGYVFRLPYLYIAFVALVGMANIPKVIINSYKNMYEQKRFSDVNIYIEQLLYSFRKRPVILTSLQDVANIIEKDSPMKTVIEKAIHHILYDFESENVNEEGLKIIEKEYHCPRILEVHRLLLKVVKNGGDYQNSIKVLLTSRRVWEVETCKNQKKCKNMQRMVEIALCITCLCVTFTPLIFSRALQQIDITGYALYRVGTAFMMVLGILIFTKTDKLATINWIESESELTPKEQISLYNRVENYDFKKERKKSVFWTIPPIVFLVMFLVMKVKIGIAVSVFMIIITSQQHKIGYSMARKRLVQEVNKAFPQWLMEMSLLLQTTQNVHAAINQSLKEAPPILIPALKKLQREIEEQPESNIPYCNFLKKYNYMDISSAMGMLYSISNGSGGDADSQIEEILEKNVVLLSQMEELINEKRITAIRGQFFMPTCVGGMKFAVDLTLIIVAFMSMRF